jgi:uncharacterized protein (TIGR02466 family)
MTTQRIFSIPLYIDEVKDIGNIQVEFKKLLANIEFKKRLDWDPNIQSLSDPTFTEDLIGKYNLKHFEKELFIHLAKYANSVGFTDNIPFKTVSWLTETNKGEYSHRHSHGPCDVCGVYYIQTTGHDGHFWVENPMNQLLETSVFFLNDSREKLGFKPKVGQIILFPSWLKHGINKNETDSKRISFSFNIFFERV